MMHLLALLDGGTPGTPAEPSRVAGRIPQKQPPDQCFTIGGTHGTQGTLEIGQADTHDNLAQRIADLCDAFQERVAICLEAGDIGEAEAHRIAQAEIGRRFVEMFMPSQVAP